MVLFSLPMFLYYGILKDDFIIQPIPLCPAFFLPFLPSPYYSLSLLLSDPLLHLLVFFHPLLLPSDFWYLFCSLCDLGVLVLTLGLGNLAPQVLWMSVNIVSVSIFLTKCVPRSQYILIFWPFFNYVTFRFFFLLSKPASKCISGWLFH